jgi:hypothetical protein
MFYMECGGGEEGEIQLRVKNRFSRKNLSGIRQLDLAISQQMHQTVP